MKEITTLSVGSYEENCSIVKDEAGKAWIIDPGQDAGRIVAAVEALGAVPAAVLLTHAHFDHIGAIPGLKAKWPGLKIYVGEEDVAMFAHPANCFPPDYPLVAMPEGVVTIDEKGAEGVPFKVIATPGHTRGGRCYLLEEDGVLFAGDTLFCGSVGRTDFPGGSMISLLDSLKKLTALPDATRVISGHGPATTIGREKASNPFLVR